MGQKNILHLFRLLEHRRKLTDSKPSYPTTDLGNKESLRRMLFGKFDKLVHIGFDRFYSPA